MAPRNQQAHHSEQPLKPVTDPDRIDAILRAIEEFDIVGSEGWGNLDELSSNTELEGVEPNPEGIFESPDMTFQAIGSVYVTLNYGGKQDSTSMSDSYPFHAFGRFEPDGHALVQQFKVDTSSFSA
jgi:hypothetical protein